MIAWHALNACQRFSPFFFSYTINNTLKFTQYEVLLLFYALIEAMCSLFLYLSLPPLRDIRTYKYMSFLQPFQNIKLA
jgi:hypothetical protein